MSEQQLRAELDAVYRSTSWRITAPFRLLVSLIKQPRTILGLPKRLVRKLKHLATHRSIEHSIAANQECVQDKQLSEQSKQDQELVMSANCQHLSPAARDIFFKLKINYKNN